MSFDELRESIKSDAAPPGDASLAIQALWHDARGEWDRAHSAVQNGPQARGRDCDWVHGYLHRKEGDLGNAGYWYLRAGRPMPAESVTVEAEWASIVRALLAEPQRP